MYSELQGDHVAFQCLFVEGMKTKLAVKKDFCQEVFSLVSRNMAWCLALKNLFPGRQILEDTGCDAEMHHCSKAVSYFMACSHMHDQFVHGAFVSRSLYEEALKSPPSYGA